jgi:hypothetical protein
MNDTQDAGGTAEQPDPQEDASQADDESSDQDQQNEASQAGEKKTGPVADPKVTEEPFPQWK